MDNKELFAEIQSIFEEKIPFNEVLGLKVESLDPDNPRIRLNMRKELIGNYHHGILHGGVTATVLDVTGGLCFFGHA